MQQRGVDWEVSLVFKKQLYLNPTEDSKDPTEFDLFFQQVKERERKRERQRKKEDR